MIGWRVDAPTPASARSDFDWGATDEASVRTLDAHAFWPELTGFRAVLTHGDGKVRATLELSDGGAALKHYLDQGGRAIDVAPHYLALLGVDDRPRTITARLHWRGAAGLVPQCAISRLRLHATNRQTLPKSRHRPMQQVGPKFPKSGAPVPQDDVPVDPPAHGAGGPGKPTFAVSSSDPPSLDGLVMGFVDFGCAFAHSRFRDARETFGTRVEFFWDQGRGVATSGASPWHANASFGYGREATRRTLNEVMTVALGRRARRDRDTERDCYRATGQDEITDDSTLHGTAVMDMACGDNGSQDAASTAKIVFVQLPALSVDDLSGGWLSAYLIDGIEYILSKCRPEARIVINVSLGSYGGSHDGRSITEAALDAICQRHPHDFALVLAAGNAPRPIDERPRHIHGHCRLRPGQSRRFHWVVPSDDATQNSLEIWHRVDNDAARSSIDCRVTPPGLAAVCVSQGQHAALMAGSAPVAAVYNRAAGPAKDSGVTIVSTGPTRSGLEHWPTPAPDGQWLIEVTNTSQRTISVHAWVERDDPDRNDLQRDLLQSYLEGIPRQPFVDEACTLTGQATAQRPIVVGNLELGHPLPTAARDSARGPSRGQRRGPDLSAPGSGFDLTGIPVARDLGGDRWAARGTSIAAPVVARAVARLLSAPGAKPLARADLLRRLLGDARRARPDPQLGWGSIDLDGQPITAPSTATSASAAAVADARRGPAG